MLVAGQVYTKPVSSLDLFPTFLTAAGGVLPPALEGVNLLPYLIGSAVQPDRYLYWGSKSKSAVRRGNWKLKRAGATKELYDLTKDISEKTNVAAANTKVVQDLDRARVAWLATLAPAQ